MRKPMLILVLKACIKRGLKLEACAAALAYIFALRVPSELLRQTEARHFSISANRIRYGPICRKSSVTMVSLTRHCTCAACPLLCPHPWVAYLYKHAPRGKCFNFTASMLMLALRPALLESGIREDELSEWTSHCFRRGSGVDVLRQHGVQAMLNHGGWSSAHAAEPYASADEQFAQGLSHPAIDFSDDDT